MKITRLHILSFLAFILCTSIFIMVFLSIKSDIEREKIKEQLRIIIKSRNLLWEYEKNSQALKSVKRC